MADYLQNLGRGWRVGSAIACSLTSALFLLCGAAIWSDMLKRGDFYYEDKPLWMGGLILVFLGIAAAYLGWRLATGQPSANGITLTPTWFISAFGVFLLLGAGFISFATRRPWMLLEAGTVTAGMIFVSKLVRQRQRSEIIGRLAALPESERQRVLSQLSEASREELRAMLEKSA